MFIGPKIGEGGDRVFSPGNCSRSNSGWARDVGTNIPVTEGSQFLQLYPGMCFGTEKGGPTWISLCFEV